MNAAFINYLDKLTNMTESLRYPIIRNKTTFKQTLSIALNASKFDSDLLTAPRNLKDFIQEIFDLHERHVTTDLTTNKNFFSNNYIVDVLFCSLLQ